MAKHNAFVKFDLKYLRPFFTRRFTQQELQDCQSQMTDLTNRWYQNVRVSPEHTDEEELCYERGWRYAQASSVSMHTIL